MSLLKYYFSLINFFIKKRLLLAYLSKIKYQHHFLLFKLGIFILVNIKILFQKDKDISSIFYPSNAYLFLVILLKINLLELNVPLDNSLVK